SLSSSYDGMKRLKRYWEIGRVVRKLVKEAYQLVKESYHNVDDDDKLMMSDDDYERESSIVKQMLLEQDETIRALASEANEVRVMANSLKNLVLKQRDECLNMYHYIEILESKLMVNNMLCKEVNRHPAGVILFPKKVINPIKYKLLLSTHHDGDDGVVVDGGKTEDTDGIEEEELKRMILSEQRGGFTEFTLTRTAEAIALLIAREEEEEEEATSQVEGRERQQESE
ncbi:hypothetical protein FOZ62_005960, partial [Perkinsus olseni]